jgi:Penicillin binding protein transpeptidase domain
MKAGRVLGSGLIAAALLTTASLVQADDSPAAPCATAIASGAVCEAANKYAVERMKERNLEAIIVIQDVQTGALVAFAASDPAKFDVTTSILPLSPVKLMVAAAWLDHQGRHDTNVPESEKLLADSIVSGNDDAGRRLALALCQAVGTETVLADLERYGFPARFAEPPKLDTTFWAELAPPLRDRLIPAPAYHSLGKETATKDWEDTLSIGERRIVVTAFHLSRFLQAVGNGGIMLPVVARAEPVKAPTQFGPNGKAIQVVSESAALKLQTLMRGTVERGTAKSAAPILAGSGWAMGGKTGTGPEPGTNAAGPASDGCFAGLIFDPQGKAQFTVVTLVKHGGLGGGNAAQISAELARFVSGAL